MPILVAFVAVFFTPVLVATAVQCACDAAPATGWPGCSAIGPYVVDGFVTMTADVAACDALSYSCQAGQILGWCASL